MSAMGKVEQYRRDDRERMSDDQKHQRDAAGVLVGAKVIMIAASLTPISAPVAIAIGTGVSLAGKQIARFQEGEAPSLGGAVKDLPQVVQESKDFNALANNLKSKWTDVAQKYDAYHKQNGSVAPPPGAKTDTKDKGVDPKAALGESLGSFVSSLSDVVSHLNNPQPTQLNEDKYDLDNKALQAQLQRIGEIRQEEAATTADLAALQQKLGDGEAKIARLGELKSDLARLKIEDDPSIAERKSLAWANHQNEVQAAITQSVLLLRSYKYHTLQEPPTRISESYLESHYRPSAPMEASEDGKNDFFRTSSKVSLKSSLDANTNSLQADLKTMRDDLSRGYVSFENGFIKRGTGNPEYQSSCMLLQLPNSRQQKDPNCEFVLALNAEIARQWKFQGSPHPAAIPIPLKIKRTYQDTPRRLWDVSVRVEYKDKTLANYGTIEFDVEHPMFGQLWGAKDDDCTLVDMRKLGDVALVQPYITTCNGSSACEHDALSLPDVLKAENNSHAPLPLDTIYFLKPIVSGEILREPPQVVTVYVKLWFVE